jgi:glycerophosphoryl diester phosphodiesterase
LSYLKKIFRITPVLFILLHVLFSSCNTEKKTSTRNNKIVIAHRGASGYLPEHTMESKAMAYKMNADFIEQDVVLSKDNVPIVIHDIHLEAVTDVAVKFEERKRKDLRYYAIDFTFAELQTLKVYERFDPTTGLAIYKNRFPSTTGNFKLHSLQQEIEFIQDLNTKTGKNTGIYPEIKAPEFHKNEGKDIAVIVLNALSNYGYKTKKDNCILQCFDAKTLKRIRKELKSKLFLVQLMESDEASKKLNDFASYADGIGPYYKQILNTKVAGKFKFTSLVSEAHKLGLKVHPYTFRADDLGEFSSFKEMMQTLLIDANTDGGFTDFPDLMVAFLNTKK